MIGKDFLKNTVYPNTMTPKSVVHELLFYLQDVLDKNIHGDIVECGTWKGGLSALMLKTLIQNNINKHIYIYDTFEGMPKPTESDVYHNGGSAIDIFNQKKDSGEFSNWCRASIDVVNHTLKSVTPSYHVYTTLIKGKVENTLLENKNLPESVCLARLDTDWYKSTKVELEVFYKKISPGGIIILDDYNSWQGQKKATDEFLKMLKDRPMDIVEGQNKSLIIRK
jgi:O-methyltransferase